MAEKKTLSELLEDATPVMDWARDLVIKQYELEEERGYVEIEVYID